MTEEELFVYLKNTIYPDLVKSHKPMSRWDCYSPHFYHRIELKCRGRHYDTLLIEKKKYDALHLKCSDTIDTPMYINSTPEGIYSFNLFEINPVWEVQFHNKTTHFTENHKIKKMVAMLDIKDAKKL